MLYFNVQLLLTFKGRKDAVVNVSDSPCWQALNLHDRFCGETAGHDRIMSDYSVNEATVYLVKD